MYKFLPVDHHAWNLDCLLRSLDIQNSRYQWSHICNWLHMASSMESVTLITEKFDSSLDFCSSARAYEKSRSAMLSQLAVKLSTFNFIWGAFESLIETLEPLIPGCNINKFGKINTARYILRKTSVKTINGYRASLDMLLNLYNATVRDCVDHTNIKFNEKGIFIVYKIRNKFAHGAYDLPQIPNEAEDLQVSDIPLIDISSTIVLLTMQMLLNSYFKNQNIYLTELFLFNEFYDEESIPLIPLLRSIHLEDYVEIIMHT